jgi:hypothetical protein
MKSMFVAAAAVAAAWSLILSGTASAAVTGPAGAFSHPKHHAKPAAVTQVTGHKLSTALLPGSDWGAGYTSLGEKDTGSSLDSPASTSMSGLTCDNLSGAVQGHGQTAEASDTIAGEDVTAPPGNLFAGLQDISQFATSKTASSYVQQLLAKFKSCATYEQSTQPSTSGPITLESLSSTKVDGYYAFNVLQETTDQTGTGQTVTAYINTTVVNAGADVYSVMEFNFASRTVSTALLTSLIGRTRALYQ